MRIEREYQQKLKRTFAKLGKKSVFFNFILYFGYHNGGEKEKPFFSVLLRSKNPSDGIT